MFRKHTEGGKSSNNYSRRENGLDRKKKAVGLSALRGKTCKVTVCQEEPPVKDKINR